MSKNSLPSSERTWSDDIEKVLESIRHNASVMSEFHKKNFIDFKAQLKYYKIPIIVISGLNSVFAVGLQPYVDQGIISGSNCLLALLCGIIGSIELFLGIQSSMENELMASKNFYLLAVDIYKTLTLNRKHRNSTGKDYLEEKYSEYTKLYESAQVIKSKVKDKLATIPTINDAGEMSMSPSPVYLNEETALRTIEMSDMTPKESMKELEEFRDRVRTKSKSVIGGVNIELPKPNTQMLFGNNYFNEPRMEDFKIDLEEGSSESANESP
jgi:hypothetical protein